MHRIILLFATASVLFLWSCGSNTANTGSSDLVQIDSTAIDSYIATLASDEFQGRKPFTEGETKTLDFLETTFEELGLQPGNGDSYFQEVPLVEITPFPEETMTVKGKANSYDLKLGEEFVAYTQRVQDAIKVADSELVFCGYGIVAPEYNWNDYEGIDMKGKTAVVLVNDPGFGSGDSTFFKGDIMTYYGRWTYKYEEAARQGAEGVLIIHETKMAGYPWFVVSSSWSGAKLDLQTPNDNMDKCALQGWITLTTAGKLFDAAGRKGTNFLELAKSKDFKPFSLDATMSHSLTNTFKKDVSQNAVAMIEGTEYPEEYIIYSAHWDHLGIGQPVAGDSIYNGALDNASGTAAVLAIAKAFSEAPEKPKRSVVFLLVTAEEQGLLGSAHYALNPIFPANQTVANLNMDGMNPYGEMNDLTITGYGQSELDDYAAEAAKAQGRYLLPDQEPEKGYFFRSDHFNFAKIGIPALFATGGYDHREKGKEYAKEQQQAYTTDRYHRPADEYDETWNLSGVVQDAQLYYSIGQRLANETTFPQWKEGSEFKAIREKDMGVKN